MSMVREIPAHVKIARDKGLLDESRFYRLVSERANYMDEATVKAIYLSMVAVVGSEIKANHVARLPYIGDLALVTIPARMGLVGRARKFLAESKVLKFIPNEGLRRHINEYIRIKQI